MSFSESYSTPPSANSTRITYKHAGQLVESNAKNCYGRKIQHSSYIATPAETSTAFIRNYLGQATVNSTAISTIKTMEKSTYTSKSSYTSKTSTSSRTTEDKLKSVATSTATTTSRESGKINISVVSTTTTANNEDLKSPKKSRKSVGFKNPLVASSQESDTINISVVSTTTTANTNNEDLKSSKISRKSIGSKKPVVVRKSITAKTSSEAPKAVGNCKTVQTIEKVLKQIKMTKYTQSFKKVDIEKFKALREIDLNAIGITRPSEIKIFKEAINKAKTEKS